VEEVVSLHERTYSGGSAGVEFTERRRFKRIPVVRPVKYLSKEFGETSSLVLELSYGGAYIESPVVAVGSQIEMEFSLMDGHTVRATAIVRYVLLGAGMGVEFQLISDEDKAQIERFVKGFRIQATVTATDDLK
jgi:c-di-GMP-binding flagellar brake protein YcgR